MTRDAKYVAIDTETTGMDPRRHRIVSFAVILLNESLQPTKTWSEEVNPGVPIPLEAVKRHGIDDRQVRGCPPFHAYGSRLANLIRNHVVIGYNVRFDLAIIHAELLRNHLPGLPFRIPVVDPYLLFCEDHPRTLTAALQEYCSRPHLAAHDALADATATIEVLRAQMQHRGTTTPPVTHTTRIQRAGHA